MVIKCKICGAIDNRAVAVDDTVLCQKHFEMLLSLELLYKYDADTDWHYGLSSSDDVDEALDSTLYIRDIVEML